MLGKRQPGVKKARLSLRRKKAGTCMALVLHPPQERVLLHGITWQTFERLLADRGDTAGVRLAYDQGTVELSMPSPEHAWYKGILTQIVDAIALARDLHYENLASTTCTRADLTRGFEPDACFYIQHADSIQAGQGLDLRVDPPPDLVIEIDITSPSLNKLPLYAALGVPEVWRYTRSGLHLYQRQGSDYARITASTVLLGIRQTALTQFIAASRTMTNRTAWFKTVVATVQASDADAPRV